MKVIKYLWEMLGKNERSAAIRLFIFLMIGMFLETLSVGVILPLLTMLTQGNNDYQYNKILLEININQLSKERLIILSVLLFVALYVIKSIFLGFLIWKQGVFVYGLQANLSQQLFAGYMCQPYTFHLQRNSSQLIHNTINQTAEVSLIVNQGLILGTEVLVVIGVSVLLLLVEPIGTFVVICVLAIAGLTFSRVTHNRILRWGQARHSFERLRILHAQQGLGGVKDIKLLGREGAFINQYAQHCINSSTVGRLHTTLQGMPRILLETIAVMSLGIVVIVIINQQKPINSIVPILGLYAAAAFRIMPSANRVLSSIQNIRFVWPVIESIHKEFCLISKKKNEQQASNIIFKSELVLENVSFKYPSAKSEALTNINISIRKGASVGFVGGSGAGKTTLIDIVLGLLTPSSGVVKVDGADIQANLRGWQNMIGYVPQSVYLTDDTIRRNIAFGIEDDQVNEICLWDAIRAAQLEDFIKGLPEGSNTIVGERGVCLSGGQRQRIAIARALYNHPEVLVLDEATSALDPETEFNVVEAIQALRGEKTILVIAHRLTTVEHCDQIFRLDKGCTIERC